MPINNAAADACVETLLTNLGLDAEQKATARPRWRVVVRALFASIRANAVVTVPVDPSDVALQTYTVPPAGPVATTGPLVSRSLDGTVS